MAASGEQWSIRVIRKNTVVHFATETFCLVSRDHSVLRYDYASETFTTVCVLPPPDTGLLRRLKYTLARSALAQWLRPRTGISHVTLTPNGHIVIVYDRIYVYRHADTGGVASACELEDATDFATPLRNGITTHAASGLVYFGEYLNNHACDIRVFCIDPENGRARVCWTFQRAEIKHVHAIAYDRFRNRLWITTGDSDAESAFYYTDDEFVTLERFNGGDQTWRAIALLFDATGMEWGMDAGKDAPADAINYIYRYDFTEGQRTRLQEIGNPAYAAMELSDGRALMATTFEPGRRQPTPECAALWLREKNGSWAEVLSLEYAGSGMRGISGYGMIFLPMGTGNGNHAVCTPVNCRRQHLTLVDAAVGLR